MKKNSILHEHGVGKKYKKGCEECQETSRAYMKAQYQKNPDKFKRRAKQHRKSKAFAARRKHNVAFLVAAKNVPCADCNQRFPTPVMEFDHLPGQTKSFSPYGALMLSIERLQEEIDKCEVVCANCHNLRTAQRSGWKE